jgi:hypothetical protein
MHFVPNWIMHKLNEIEFVSEHKPILSQPQRSPSYNSPRAADSFRPIRRNKAKIRIEHRIGAKKPKEFFLKPQRKVESINFQKFTQIPDPLRLGNSLQSNSISPKFANKKYSDHFFREGKNRIKARRVSEYPRNEVRRGKSRLNEFAVQCDILEESDRTTVSPTVYMRKQSSIPASDIFKLPQLF